MTSNTRSTGMTNPVSRLHRISLRIALALVSGFLGLASIGGSATAQTYSCFPTCSSTDARFLTVAGTGYNTLINSEVVMKIGSPGVASTVEIGIFDGETGLHWDAGTTPLNYNLYADPTGEGTGTTLVANFPASQMIDNAWKTFTVTNVASARAANGNYLYRLVITTTDPFANYWSSFKVRTTGSVVLKAQAFSVAATALTDADLEIVYPNGLANLTSTTYDGTWRMFLDVQTKGASMSIWDGDMDFGSFDCSNNDVDDLNTPNTVLPPWASPVSANLEGVGAGGPCVGTTGNMTGTPPDDNRYPIFRRTPAVTYQVITPQGQIYTNSNPSGGKEWEEFKLSTGAPDPYLNDLHADSLPAGVYEVRVNAMDLGNLNAWRVFSDVLGVCADGTPCPVYRPNEIQGTVTLEATSSTILSGSGAIANATVVLTGDINGDNLIDVNRTTTTNSTGGYSFPNLAPGTYTVTVVTSTLPSGSIALDDFDGVSTPNVARAVIPVGGANPGDVFFVYTQSATATGGTRTQGYWKTHASAWPSTSILMGCTVYSRSQAIAIMDRPASGDKTYNMFEQLAAAKLNVANGARYNCILQTIVDAEAWLCDHPVGSGVAAGSSAWRDGADDLHKTLDDYNNGRMCASHID